MDMGITTFQNSCEQMCFRYSAVISGAEQSHFLHHLPGGVRNPLVAPIHMLVHFQGADHLAAGAVTMGMLRGGADTLTTATVGDVGMAFQLAAGDTAFAVLMLGAAAGIAVGVGLLATGIGTAFVMGMCVGADAILTNLTRCVADMGAAVAVFVVAVYFGFAVAAGAVDMDSLAAVLGMDMQTAVFATVQNVGMLRQQALQLAAGFFPMGMGILAADRLCARLLNSLTLLFPLGALGDFCGGRFGALHFQRVPQLIGATTFCCQYMGREQG